MLCLDKRSYKRNVNYLRINFQETTETCLREFWCHCVNIQNYITLLLDEIKYIPGENNIVFCTPKHSWKHLIRLKRWSKIKYYEILYKNDKNNLVEINVINISYWAFLFIFWLSNVSIVMFYRIVVNLIYTFRHFISYDLRNRKMVSFSSVCICKLSSANMHISRMYVFGS